MRMMRWLHRLSMGFVLHFSFFPFLSEHKQRVAFVLLSSTLTPLSPRPGCGTPRSRRSRRLDHSMALRHRHTRSCHWDRNRSHTARWQWLFQTGHVLIQTVDERCSEWTQGRNGVSKTCVLSSNCCFGSSNVVGACVRTKEACANVWALRVRATAIAACSLRCICHARHSCIRRLPLLTRLTRRSCERTCIVGRGWIERRASHHRSFSTPSLA